MSSRMQMEQRVRTPGLPSTIDSQSLCLALATYSLSKLKTFLAPISLSTSRRCNCLFDGILLDGWNLGQPGSNHIVRLVTTVYTQRFSLPEAGIFFVRSCPLPVPYDATLPRCSTRPQMRIGAPLRCDCTTLKRRIACQKITLPSFKITPVASDSLVITYP